MALSPDRWFGRTPKPDNRVIVPALAYARALARLSPPLRALGCSDNEIRGAATAEAQGSALATRAVYRLIIARLSLDLRDALYPADPPADLPA